MDGVAVQLMTDEHAQRAVASRKFAAGHEKRQEEATVIHGNWQL